MPFRSFLRSSHRESFFSPSSPSSPLFIFLSFAIQTSTSWGLTQNDFWVQCPAWWGWKDMNRLKNDSRRQYLPKGPFDFSSFSSDSGDWCPTFKCGKNERSPNVYSLPLLWVVILLMLCVVGENGATERCVIIFYDPLDVPKMINLSQTLFLRFPWPHFLSVEGELLPRKNSCSSRGQHVLRICPQLIHFLSFELLPGHRPSALKVGKVTFLT